MSSLQKKRKQPLTDLDQNTIRVDDSPTVCFDHQNFIVSLNGEPIDYDNQTLTENGLEISVGQSNQGSIKVLVDLDKSAAFDAKLKENVYCMELAKTLDRGSNSAFHFTKRGRKSSVNPNSYNFQICEIIMKKIPFKTRCFQTVFSNISSIKIAFLLENDKFYLQLAKYICGLIFKVDLNQIFENLKPKSQLLEKNQNSQKEMKNMEIKQKCLKNTKIPNQAKVSTYHKQVIEVFERIKGNISKYKFSFERINLLFTIFTRENRLYNFLQEMNKQIVCSILSKDLSKFFYFQQQYYSSCNKLASPRNLHETLLKLISVIKTVHSSLGKSSASFDTLKNVFLGNSEFPTWLSQSLERVVQDKLTASKLVELFSLIVQICPPFLANFYQSNQIPLNTIVQQQIQWIFETLNTFYPSEEQQKAQHEYAHTILDCLSTICRTMIKQATSSVNIGRIICKSLCETATNLRFCDIQMLTFVCCTSSYSRQNVMRYLFAYFRRFIRGVKASLKGTLKDSVKAIRKNKHYLLQIMQSIRKISQIQSVDLTIDSELLEDIELILRLSKSTDNPKSIFSYKDRGDCVWSAYWAMLKNVKIENPKSP